MPLCYHFPPFLRSLRRPTQTLVLGFLAANIFSFSIVEANDWKAGVAKRDITPNGSIRLSGYAARSTPTDKVADPLSVRALYLAAPESKPLLIISVDAIGIAPWMTEAIASAASDSLQLSRSQIAICTTHAHTAPYLDGSIVNLFGAPLPQDQKDATRAYSEFLVAQTIDAIKEAAANLQEAQVTIGEGHATFAANRRPPIIPATGNAASPVPGPVDHRVRILSVKNTDGKDLAIAFQYACHSTTISPEINQISADWGGLAAANLESELPGVIALPIIGTGADANPSPRGKYENAIEHGKSLSNAILEAMPNVTKQLPAPSTVAFSYTALDFERPSTELLNSKLESPMYQERFWAQSMLDILKVKDRIPESYPAPAHLWTFGNELAWVFLGGEVVVDYQIRLETELSQFSDVWVASYVDDVFAYVASERVRAEGGYEVDSSMLYYNQPGRWISGTEEKWVKSILDLQRQDRPIDEPLAADEALKRIQVPQGWSIEQMAVEPLTEDPVNFSFGIDGTLWVAEMGDYPYGDQSKGRIRRLRDTDGDGVMDEAVSFIEEVDFPAGIIAWRDGVVIAAAPEIFFARDTDGDGVADERRTILSGFPAANPQHRVHGFTYGLDNKLYFGTGVAVNEITLHKLDGTTEIFHAHGSDLCLDPDRHELSLESGDTQYIRAQDAWGNWFGNDNSHPMYHFMYDKNWKRDGVNLPRSLYQSITNPPRTPQVFPLSQPLDRFNEPYSANRFTSVCSSIINLSPATGSAMQGAALVCEPVHNLISRFDVKPSGMTFSANRFTEDAQSEWIRSDDPWFRPVRVVNAPDGSVWFADMYRRVIEHPTWIPEEWLARVDVYAGSKQGRIYRVFQSKDKLNAPDLLVGKELPELIAALSHENFAIAEFAQQQILWHHSEASQTESHLRKNLREAASPQARLRSFAILKYLKKVDASLWQNILRDKDPRVVGYGLQEITRLHLEQGNLAGPSSQLLGECLERDDVAGNPLLARLLFVAAANDPNLSGDKIAKMLLRHQQVAGIDGLLQFVDNDRFDAIAKAVLTNADANTLGLVERMIPRLSAELQTELVQTIKSDAASRPAWHFTLATQLLRNEATAKSLDENFKKQLLASGVNAICDSEIALSIKQAALEFANQQGALQSPDIVEKLYQAIRLSKDPVVVSTLSRALISQPEPVLQLLLKLSEDSESVQELLVQSLLSQSRTANWILDRIIQKEVATPKVAASILENLRNQNDASLQSKLTQVFGEDERVNRDDIVQSYIQAWPKDADVSRGKSLYVQHCAACHSDREIQGERIAAIGPVLTAMNHWTNDAWITAILDPSKSVDAKYLRTTILTEDDEVISGLRIGETDTEIEVVTTDGRIESIEKQRIAETKDSKQSLMPDGFEKTLSPSQIADIVKFLRSSE